MLLTALKRDQPARTGQPARKALEDMTTFKPFNVRETEWEVWDVKDYMTEQYYKAHSNLFNNSMPVFGGGSPSAPSAANVHPHNPN